MFPPCKFVISLAIEIPNHFPSAYLLLDFSFLQTGRTSLEWLRMLLPDILIQNCYRASSFFQHNTIPNIFNAFSAELESARHYPLGRPTIKVVSEEIGLRRVGRSATFRVAMRGAGTDLKTAWRAQITGAGLGTRLANSIRLASYPKSGDSLNAAALVCAFAQGIQKQDRTLPDIA